MQANQQNSQEDVKPISESDLKKQKLAFSAVVPGLLFLNWYLETPESEDEQSTQMVVYAIGFLLLSELVTGVWMASRARNVHINFAITASAVFVAITLLTFILVKFIEPELPSFWLYIAASVSLLGIWLIVPSKSGNE